MKLTEVSNVVSINFHKPKPDQIGANRPDKFKFKKGDMVSHNEYPGMYGTIVKTLFMHETDIIRYVPEQNRENGYQEHIDYINSKHEGDAFRPWYKIEWTNASELEQERGTSIGLEGEFTLTKIDSRTDNLIRLK